MKNTEACQSFRWPFTVDEVSSQTSEKNNPDKTLIFDLSGMPVELCVDKAHQQIPWCAGLVLLAVRRKKIDLSNGE